MSSGAYSPRAFVGLGGCAVEGVPAVRRRACVALSCALSLLIISSQRFCVSAICDCTAEGGVNATVWRGLLTNSAVAHHLATVAVQLPTVCAVGERVSGRLMYVVEQACAGRMAIATGWCFVLRLL